VKFLVDLCAGHRLAEWLKQRGHDVVESRERSATLSDRAILEWAVTESRIVVTMDKDFGDFIFLEGKGHCGLIRLPDVPVERRIALMGKILADHTNDLLAQSIVTVRGERIRISRPMAGGNE
jgi:predicted nuclease of predicted toxin-antitoxin system